MLERDRVALNLTETHKTVKNIKERKGFVVHIADAKHAVEADFFGIASGNTMQDKFEKSGLTATKSDLVIRKWSVSDHRYGGSWSVHRVCIRK